jgi:hypothetical protein
VIVSVVCVNSSNGREHCNDRNGEGGCLLRGSETDTRKYILLLLLATSAVLYVLCGYGLHIVHMVRYYSTSYTFCAAVGAGAPRARAMLQPARIHIKEGARYWETTRGK